MFGSQTLTYLSHNDVHLVAVVKNNANVMMTMTWLSSVRIQEPPSTVYILL
jgi:hypothetical protein